MPSRRLCCPGCAQGRQRRLLQQGLSPVGVHLSPVRRFLQMGRASRPASRLFLLLLLPAVLFLCASCRKKTVWQIDYDAALQAAKAQGKDVFVLFSGEDWDGKTAGFRTDVLDTEEFSAFVKDKYVLLNIDLSEAEQANAIAAPDADERAKADAARLQSDIDAKNTVIRLYGISSYPTVCILSNEGYVLSFVQYNEGLNSPSVLMDVLDELAPGMTEVSAAIRQVQLSAGAEKVRAIDSLYTVTPEAGRRPLAGLVREVPSLDPADESGLVGKYEFIKTYDEVIESLSDGRNEGVVEFFVTLAEHGHLGPAQKLEAYYNAAYLMALLGDSDYDRMFELLQKAQDVDPENVRMEDIANLKQMISQMRDIMNQDEGFLPGMTVQGD